MKKIENFCCVYVGLIEDFSGNDVLPSFVQEKINVIQNQKVIKQKKASYGLLKKAVKEVLDFDDDFSLVKQEKNGKPICENYFFSISHCQNLVAVALSDVNVGLDIEVVKAHKNFKDLKNKILNKNEHKLSIENMDDLTELWVKKESRFKFDGDAVFIPKNIDTNNFQYHIDCFEYGGENYYLSVATEQDKVEVQYLIKKS